MLKKVLIKNNTKAFKAAEKNIHFDWNISLELLIYSAALFESIILMMLSFLHPAESLVKSGSGCPVVIAESHELTLWEQAIR